MRIKAAEVGYFPTTKHSEKYAAAQSLRSEAEEIAATFQQLDNRDQVDLHSDPERVVVLRNPTLGGSGVYQPSGDFELTSNDADPSTIRVRRSKGPLGLGQERLTIEKRYSPGPLGQWEEAVFYANGDVSHRSF